MSQLPPPPPSGSYPPPAPGWNSGYPDPRAVPPGNGFAVAALVLGICGFVLMGIPFFIGLLLGGLPDLLAVVFGILGIVRANEIGGSGRAMAIVGLVLASVSLLSVFVGAGWLW